MSKKSTAFGQTSTPDETPKVDLDGFNLDAFIRGTGVLTRTVEVCGQPQLMGRIEELKAMLERPDASDVDDDRPMAPNPRIAIARELEDLREQMLASITTWKFRGLRNGEFEALREECTDASTALAHISDQTKLTELDYRAWAAQVHSINGQKVDVTWEQLRDLHIGDQKRGVEGLGAHFMQTIARTANAAASGGGVDVPFSLKSLSLTSKQPKT